LVSRRLVNVTLDNLGDISPECRGCVFWELDPVAGARARANGAAELEKEAWVSDTLLEWGSCGQLIYVDGAPVGHALYAPPAYVPRAAAFPTSPASSDAVLLMSARVAPGFTGGGLGRMLIQGVARDAVRRGIKAIEAFGTTAAPPGPELAGPPAAEVAGPPAAASGDRHECLLPADYLLAVGFKTVRAHPRTPRLRLDLKTTLTWKEDVEYALERLLATVQTPALTRP
jgi:GNAT superfamily N-acetyltransferase